MNVIFMGTPEFSVPVLQGLIDSEEHTVTAVVTQPDKARGRSGKLVFTPVKEVAVDNDIPVYTPVKIKDPEFVKTLRQIPCDVIVVVAFGQILSKDILDMPAYGCINVHASLLPRWRGAAPMQWAILEGDEKTGVTTMQMAEGLDTGDMLLKREVILDPEETGGSLFDRLSEVGAELLIETLEKLERNEIIPEKQPELSPTPYASQMTKEMGRIDWNQDAVKIERLIRGLNPWPSAYTKLGEKTLKIWVAQVEEGDSKKEAGTVIRADKKGLFVQTGKGVLKILELQLEGKKRMTADAFLRGYPIREETVLGTDIC